MLLGCVEGDTWSKTVGKIETLGGRILDIPLAKKMGQKISYHLIKGSDPQEEQINLLGGKVGYKICKGTPRTFKTTREVLHKHVGGLHNYEGISF